MKKNRIMWGLVSLMVLITIAVSFGIRDGYTQQQDNNSQPKNYRDKAQDYEVRYDDTSKYPIVDYDSEKPSDPKEAKKREEKSKRYDKIGFILKNPHPDDSGVLSFDDDAIPEAISLKKSNLIIIGQIISGEAFLTNKKNSVYSEYTIAIEEILFSENKNLTVGSTITMDRFGGYVRYPNGQKVFYGIAGKDLPRVTDRYILFLNTKGNSSNYEILTGYKYDENKVEVLDAIPDFSEIKGKKGKELKDFIKNKIKSNKPQKIREKDNANKI
ncbi:MAG: hypothetical protein M3405_06345 [Acidobacteriota bacterium]|jgi:hypothetical protein|nr:hypothetical protein [Acidobacteriota bacterium]